MKSLILGIGPPVIKPWWWNHVDFQSLGCEIKYVRISIGGRKSSSISAIYFPWLLAKIILILIKYKADFIFTFECGWPSFIVSFIQTVTRIRSPKHIILQFIMREKQKTLKSRIKYAFMRYCFSSLYVAVCSSKQEMKYYEKTFRWNRSKLIYVPFHTDPKFLAVNSQSDGSYILSAGRTFRDYPTFLSAVTGLNVKVTVVASPVNMEGNQIPKNVNVLYDISQEDLTELIRNAMIIVIPLQHREISIGQSVVLQAMAMGKAIIATQTNGTMDYIDHMVNGILIESGNSDQLRNSICTLLQDKQLITTLGANARKKVEERYLPQHYLNNVVRALSIISRRNKT